MIDLSNITLVTIGSTNIHKTRKALSECQKSAQFFETYFFTERKNHDLTPNITYVEIDPICSLAEYNRYRVLNFTNDFLPLLKTDYYLVVEWDGYIVNPSAWSNKFLEYDYIGAPFPFMGICGNGGFSLRSKRFLETQKQLCTETDYKQFPEDLFLCLINRKKFIESGCKYAPLDVGYMFSTEAGDYNKNQSFGFHSFLLNPQFSN